MATYYLSYAVFICMFSFIICENQSGPDTISPQPNGLIVAKASVDQFNSSICTKDEFICAAGCSQLVRCFRQGNGTFGVHTVRRCEGKITSMCNVSAMDCSASTCEDYGLSSQVQKCVENGLFPNLQECNKYYICQNGVRTDATCGNGTIYNPLNKNCTTNLEGCTKTPIVTCSVVGEIAAIDTNTNIFYICSYNDLGYLIPELRKCDDNYIFDNDEKACLYNSGSTIVSCLGSLFISFIIIFFT